MEDELLLSIASDGLVALAYVGLMLSLTSVSRHPALSGGVLYALGHLLYAIGSGSTMVLIDRDVPPGHVAWGSGLAFAFGTLGAAAMLAGLARLLERPLPAPVRHGGVVVLALLLLAGLPSWPGLDLQGLTAGIVNAGLMLGLALLLLAPSPMPQRVPALFAGVAAAVLFLLYLLAMLQYWADWRTPVVPDYAHWVWLDLGLWQTINLAVLILASFRALVVFVRQAQQDPLTLVLNRSGLRDEIDARRPRLPPNMPVTVLAFDIDHFKRLNDTHGHAAGDAFLGWFAERLRHQVRQADLVARIGGEEFVAILPGADAEAGRRVAETVMDAVRAGGLFWHGRPLLATVSIGLASGHGLDGIATLLERADAALYAGKHEGRDRLVEADRIA